MSLLRGLFSEKVNAKNDLPVSAAQLQEVVGINRNSLGLVENWIDKAAFEKSCFQYGVPDYIAKNINSSIGEAITYTDVMLYLAKTHFTQFNYLEIGVSVGKNFFQLLNGVSGGKFTGFDIEEINPVLEQKLAYEGKDEWETPKTSIKKTPSSLKRYTYNGMPVSYLNADVWDESSWARLKGNKFNMIFSDALHTHEAILFEFEMLVKYELLAEKLIIFWDDLNGKMRQAFFKIVKKYKQVYSIEEVYLIQINGWVGQNEPLHSVGIISTFSF